MNDKGFVLGWWSAGVTSAVACKYALQMYDNVELYYIHIDSAHPDNTRFKEDCEKWYGCEIKELKSSRFKDQFDVIRKTRAINTPSGAPCTLKLKKQVRFDFEKHHEISLFNDKVILNQVWGFEFDKKQVNRAIRFGQQYPYTNPLFPLIEKGINKDQAAGILMSAGIELPAMYKLGYSNNNCIGCVKGGKGYWNKIREDFPHEFYEMADLEKEIGHSCINGKFLHDLNPSEGRNGQEVMPNCGLICDLEFTDIEDVSLDSVLSGHKSIYDAVKNK